MHRNWTRALSLTGHLTRRLALQALISGTVMIGLQAASQMEHQLAAVDWSQLADADSSFGRPLVIAEANAPATSEPMLAAQVTPSAPASPAAASGREARLPGPASRDAAARATSVADALARVQPGHPVRAIPDRAVRAADAGSLPDGTIRFDECHPACESRDPLLQSAAYREPAEVARYAEGPAPRTPAPPSAPELPRPGDLAAAEPADVAPPAHTRAGAVWNGVVGGWQTARQTTGSVVERLGATVGLLSAER